MKMFIIAAMAVLLLTSCRLACQMEGSKKQVTNLPDTVRSPEITHGYFKCKYGTLEIVAVSAYCAPEALRFNTYGASLLCWYKPMTADDIKAFETYALSEERVHAIKASGFPGERLDLLYIGLFGDRPINHIPPSSGHLELINFRPGGGNSHIMRFSEITEKPMSEYKITLIGKNTYEVKGRFVGKCHFSKEGKDDEDDWEWDITFNERMHCDLSRFNGIP